MALDHAADITDIKKLFSVLVETIFVRLFLVLGKNIRKLKKHVT